MGIFDWLLFWLAVIAIAGAYKASQEEELLKTNPEAWKAKKVVEADQKERKQRLIGNAAATGFKVARMFWK